jgi:hypothetical protein
MYASSHDPTSDNWQDRIVLAAELPRSPTVLRADNMPCPSTQGASAGYKYAKENPDQVKKGVDWAKENPDAAKKVLPTHYAYECSRFC